MSAGPGRLVLSALAITDLRAFEAGEVQQAGGVTTVLKEAHNTSAQLKSARRKGAGLDSRDAPVPATRGRPATLCW